MSPGYAPSTPEDDHLTSPERGLCATLSVWVKAVCSILGPLSGTLTLIALLALLTLSDLTVGARALLVLLLLLRGVERYFFLRLSLDARLFDALANGSIARLADLDSGLHMLGLRKQTHTASGSAVQSLRPLTQRVAGTRTLLHRLMAVVGLQTGLFGAAVVMFLLR